MESQSQTTTALPQYGQEITTPYGYPGINGVSQLPDYSEAHQASALPPKSDTLPPPYMTTINIDPASQSTQGRRAPSPEQWKLFRIGCLVLFLIILIFITVVSMLLLLG